MFGWFKNKPRESLSDKKTEQIVEAVQTAINAYGALLQQYPMAVLDASRLPLPKAEMKAALKLSWALETNNQQRNHIEVGYVGLSNFQEGVGENPIDVSLPVDADPARVLEIMNPAAMEWHRKALEEMHALNAELREFKQNNSKSQRR